MREVYLDNSATTALSPAARAAMCAAMDAYGNPSSLHARGEEAARLLRESRERVGAALGERRLREGQLVFTASGTEANALALLGTAFAKRRRPALTVLTTDSEHPSVARQTERLAQAGFRVVTVPTRGGALDMDVVRAACTPDLFLVSMMLVNNETGARYPLREVFALAHAANPDCVCHTDAVQAFLKVPFAARELGADLVTVSSHKIHGPKGVGALYIDPRLLTARRIVPILAGGGQEAGLRSGTENTVGVAGFAAAAAEGAAGLAETCRHFDALRARLCALLAGSGVTLNLPPVCAPHILSITLPCVKSETMLHYLSERGIYVSSGSACSSRAAHPSAALLAFGLSEREASCTLRVSLSRENTEADIETFAAALREGLGTLVRMRR